MALDRLNNTRFHSDKTQSNNTAKAQIQMILANQKVLLKLKKGAELLTAVKSFDGLIKAGTPLTDKQKSFLDGIYEKMWGAAGFEAYTTPKHDIKRRFI